MTRNKLTGALIGISVAAGIYAGYDVFNATSYRNLSRQLCEEDRAKHIAKGLSWKQEDIDSCFKIVETVACWGLANGKTGPRPPGGCK